MEMAYTILVFVFGLVFGSFFNVVGLRVPMKESLIQPPSHCTTCQRQLTPKDLIPVLSYIVLRGKCRSCGQKISWIYPLMELLTGILFTFSYWQFGFSEEFIVALLLISLLVIVVVSDIAYMLMPDKVLLCFLPLLVIGRMLAPITPWWDSIVGAVFGFGILYSIAVVSRGGIGGGDIKLFFLLGLVLGTINTLLTLFIAAFIGMVVGIIVLQVRQQGRKTPIPFGPSIALAAVIVYFYGNVIVQWYVGLW
ncbi:Type 4 prepilin-like proteins leader peptide-processing enzyme [Lysinibacillus sphaericus]|uniref:Type 4 prepilin-like proteins leader peptide-processing enzyme n=1 Tax=Lysinibacillus sphaericus TaxID=1421 RepID=A0A2S5D3C2_LYSSH|nr:A24 family peptidase [Lysinibacillus sphaericus]POZ57488.1 Type 4 prepilin-like proteins leader peptide-processing enzyme [Lysinibacillus sphaericus]